MNSVTAIDSVEFDEAIVAARSGEITREQAEALIRARKVGELDCLDATSRAACATASKGVW